MKLLAVRGSLLLAGVLANLQMAPSVCDAGIIPWVYDSVFGPVGSIQAHRANRICGPSLSCGSGGYGYGNYGYSSYGYGNCGYRGGLFGLRRNWGNCCPTTCGVSACGSCNPCGTNYGYAMAAPCGSCNVGGYGYATGGCANGTCSTFYPPIVNNGTGTSTASPVTPANPGGATGSNTPSYDPSPIPTKPTDPGRSSTDPGFGPGNSPLDGFNKAASPAPTTGTDPTDGGFIPPRVNPETPAANPATPAPAPGTPASPSKRPTLDDEDKDAKVGPRLELNDKVAWKPMNVRTRQALVPVKASASVVRLALFQKSAWVNPLEGNLASK